jgi:hypothetical protein
MNRTAARLTSFAAATLFTLAMLAGVDHLATSEVSPNLQARTTVAASA